MRSRSRHSTVTDRGQTAPSASDDALEKLSREFSRVAGPSSGLAEATKLAPERAHSGLPPQMLLSAQTTPGVIVSDDPTSPPTIVPESDGTSTRPSKGGIAYPFSLKVGGDGASGHHANAAQTPARMTPSAIH